MSARDFIEPRGWGAIHIVSQASTKPYGNPARRRFPGEIHNELPPFVFDEIPGDDLHVWAHRMGNLRERTIADTPDTTPPSIHFTLTEVSGTETITTQYDGLMIVFTGSPRTITGSYRRIIGVV